MRLMIITMPVLAFVAVLGSSMQAQYDAVASADSYHPETRAILMRNWNKVKKGESFVDQAVLRRACVLAR